MYSGNAEDNDKYGIPAVCNVQQQFLKIVALCYTVTFFSCCPKFDLFGQGEPVLSEA